MGQQPINPKASAWRASSGEEYEDVEDVLYAHSVALCDIATRLAFVRKVYGIISLQLALTIGAILLCLMDSDINHYIRTHPTFLFVGLFVLLILIVPMLCFPSIRDTQPYNIIGLTLFTLVEAYMLAVLSSSYGTYVILQAVLVSAVITISLTMYTFQTRRDYDGWGLYIFVVVMTLIIGGLCRRMFPMSPVVDTVWGVVGGLLFSLLIVYDTFLLIKRLSPAQYILASLSLYLDLFNLFVSIVQTLTRHTRAS